MSGAGRARREPSVISGQKIDVNVNSRGVPLGKTIKGGHSGEN